MIGWFANIALLVSLAGCVSFIVAYWILADWRSSALGRNVMAFMVVSAVLLGIGTVRAFFPVFDPFLDWIRLGGYIAIGYVVWRRFYLLLVAQRILYREEVHE